MSSERSALRATHLQMELTVFSQSASTACLKFYGALWPLFKNDRWWPITKYFKILMNINYYQIFPIQFYIILHSFENITNVTLYCFVTQEGSKKIQFRNS